MGELSDEIRRLRSLKGMSVRQLATVLGKTAGYISRIEARGEIPTPELLVQIANTLGGSGERLLELARADEMIEAKSEIEQRYNSALILFRKAKNVE